MNTAAFLVPSNTVMTLTGLRMATVEKKLKPSLLERLMDGAGSFLFALFAPQYFESNAVKFTDDAIWFKGAAAELWEGNFDVRNIVADLTGRLERQKSSLMRVRKKMLDIQQNSDASPHVKNAAGRMVASVVDLFDSLEALRWTLLELEANHSNISGDYSASTPEGISELFARIKQEA